MKQKIINSGEQIIITDSGDYYLDKDLQILCNDEFLKISVIIDSDDVKIDFKNHFMFASAIGILITPNRKNVHVENLKMIYGKIGCIVLRNSQNIFFKSVHVCPYATTNIITNFNLSNSRIIGYANGFKSETHNFYENCQISDICKKMVLIPNIFGNNRELFDVHNIIFEQYSKLFEDRLFTFAGIHQLLLSNTCYGFVISDKSGIYDFVEEKENEKIIHG